MPLFRNPALMLAWVIPLMAVVASFATLSLAIMRPDNELPEQYHWEGFRLDRDFAQAERAAALGVEAAFHSDSVAGKCEIALRLRGEAPNTLLLTLTHATLPKLDRKLVLRRVPSALETSHHDVLYKTDCPPFAVSRWRAQLADPAGRWSLRQTLNGPIEQWRLHAR